MPKMDGVVKVTVATRGGASFELEATDLSDVKSLLRLRDEWQGRGFEDDEMLLFETRKPQSTEMSVVSGEIAFIAVSWRWPQEGDSL